MPEDKLEHAIEEFRKAAYELGRFMYQCAKSNGNYDEFRSAELKRLKHTCPVCGYSMRKGTVDHFYPQRNWPDLSYEAKNWAVICSDCNQSKSSKHPKDWFEALESEQKERFKAAYPSLLKDMNDKVA